jgi:5-hydroxyisourate hydrolase-like protein (transthyretin family)
MRPSSIAVLVLCLSLFCLSAGAAESTKLTVQVNSAASGKPVDRASVLVRFRHGRGVNLKKILTSWETKTNQDGNVTIPSIPQGEITVQVIAENFQTYGDVYQLDQPTQTISIKLNAPQAQYSEDAKSKTVPK